MGSRIFSAAVILFWLSMMVWLVVTKLAPRWGQGEPPNYLAVERSKQAAEPVVCWNLFWNEERLGWAASQWVPRAGGEATLRSRLQFTRLPKSIDVFLRWFGIDLGAKGKEPEKIDVRVSNQMELDRENRMTRFDSGVYWGDAPQSLFGINGQMKGDELKISVHSPYLNQRKESSVRVGKISVEDGVSPRGFMPPLRLRQAWKLHQFSPWHATDSRLATSEVVQAEVEREDDLFWGGQDQVCWLVVYRKDSGAGSKAADVPLGRMWVRRNDGMVLQQEVTILGARLRFVRQSAEEAIVQARILDREWTVASGAMRKPATPSLRRQAAPKQGAPATPSVSPMN